MKTSETITLGVGDLSIDGEDVGYLSGDVTITTEVEKVDFVHGTHKTLVKRFVTTLNRSIKASLAQIDMATLKVALGIGELATNEQISRLNFGANWSLAVLKNVKFVHVRDDGKKITVYFPKAQVEPGSSELTFSADNVVVQGITISAVEDLTRPDCPMGFIQEGDSEETDPFTSDSSDEGGGSTEVTPVEVTDESVSGTSEETWYIYQLAHANLLTDPAPVVKSADGNTTYTENTDYIVDHTQGIITTQGCSSTTLTGGATIKVSYSYDSSADGDEDDDEGSGGEG